MFALSGLFAATNTTIREGRAAFPDFVFGVLADGGVLFDSEERGKLCQKINPFFFWPRRYAPEPGTRPDTAHRSF